MATLTAQILIGNGHPNNDGINPSYYIFLSENDKPALILGSQNVFNNKGGEKIIWLPTIDNMLPETKQNLNSLDYPLHIQVIVKVLIVMFY